MEEGRFIKLEICSHENVTWVMTASHDTRCLNVSGVVQPIAKSVFDFFPQAQTYIHLSKNVLKIGLLWLQS